MIQSVTKGKLVTLSVRRLKDMIFLLSEITTDPSLLVFFRAPKTAINRSAKADPTDLWEKPAVRFVVSNTIIFIIIVQV